MMAAPNLTAERLRELLHFDPETGAFVRRASPQKPCGSLRPDGYLRTSVDGRYYLLHRLAWLYVHGKWPDGCVDHINRDRLDNQITNLRDVPNVANLQNIESARSDNQHGHLGVFADRKRWRAKIVVEGKSTYLGIFDTPEQASKAYLAAKRVLHPGWVAGGDS